MPEKRITKPNSTVTNESFAWDNFTKDCTNSRYVLVLGNEAILNKNVNIDVNGNSLKLLFNLTVEHLKEEGVIVSNSQDFTELGHKIHHIRTKVLETIYGLDFDKDFDNEIEPSLIELLKTKCFRVVLTTTVDPYVEIAMEKVWGKNGFRILNIYGDEKDLRPNELNSDEFNEIQPTLYYVFGKADTERIKNKFVLTENDAMSVITKWFSSERPKELLKYIQAKDMKILSIGCKFDDWLFRFFWFILRGEISNLSAGQVAVEFTKEDEKLRKYLQQQEIKLFPDARQFMNEATNKIQKVIKLENLPRKGDGIFISYAHEDKYLALPLFNKLCQQGYNVWIDESKTKPSDKYDERIMNAINSCKIFMPILSSQVMTDLKQDVDRYYREEWRIAQIRYNNEREFEDGMKVLPVVIGQYQIRSEYHQKTEECIIKATAHEVAKESLESLYKLINELTR